MAWKLLLEALDRCTLHYVESVSYVIYPKAISKDELYGTHATTRELVNALFTHFA